MFCAELCQLAGPFCTGLLKFCRAHCHGLTDLAALQGRLLGIGKEREVMPTLAEEVIALSEGCDPAVAANAQRIVAELRREETKFGSTLEAGTVRASLSCPASL